jgi:hypothetical protein
VVIQGYDDVSPFFTTAKEGGCTAMNRIEFWIGVLVIIIAIVLSQIWLSVTMPRQSKMYHDALLNQQEALVWHDRQINEIKLQLIAIGNTQGSILEAIDSLRHENK